jgi:NAD+ kinase
LAVKSVGLFVNCVRREVLAFAPRVIDWLAARNVAVCLNERTAAQIDRRDLSATSDALANVDLVITLGGDGTILAAARVAAPHGIPILGVHMGHFGFIAEIDPEELLGQLDTILAGPPDVQDRMMVRGAVMRGDREVHSAVGLNEVVVSKGGRTRMLHFRLSLGDEFMTTYHADGVVVATPTGSTAYALSTGGPLIEPTVRTLLVAPICPHTLAARPLIIPATETIELAVESDAGEVLFMADSDSVAPLEPGDRVVVRCADYSARFVTLHRDSFYRKVRTRLLWGGRESG